MAFAKQFLQNSKFALPWLIFLAVFGYVGSLRAFFRGTWLHFACPSKIVAMLFKEHAQFIFSGAKIGI